MKWRDVALWVVIITTAILLADEIVSKVDDYRWEQRQETSSRPQRPHLF